MKVPENTTVYVGGKKFKAGKSIPDELAPDSIKDADKKTKKRDEK